jgi:ABC-2 type transport system ATP-binding protein
MKILTGYHYPAAGSARIDGFSVQEEPVEVKKRLGYLPEGVPLYGELTVDEYLGFIAGIREIPAKECRAKIDAAIDACGLKAKRGAKIETLSKGYKQRTGLAQAIIHDPQILILDEPTTGLDPNQIIEIRKLITELGRSKTVILSTHILQEVEAVCSNVLILNEGKIAAQGSPESIAGTMKGGESWDLVLKVSGQGIEDSGQPSNEGYVRARLAELSEREFGGRLETGDLRATGENVYTAAFFIAGGADVSDNAEKIFDWAVAGGFKILGMNRKKLSLEDIFVRLTK